MDKNTQMKKSLPIYTTPKIYIEYIQLEKNNEVVDTLMKCQGNIFILFYLCC